MVIITKEFTYASHGNTDIIDITGDVVRTVQESKLNNGTVTVFVSGSTAGITTVEFESGLVKDLKIFFDKIIPGDEHYYHDATWGDGNGYAHLRASLLKAGETFPFAKGKLLLGTWQQIVLIDFDNRPRSRQVVVQVMGE